MLSIHDLTKEELLFLIEYKCLCHCFDENDLIWVRYEIMMKKGRAIMDEAMKGMERCMGIREDVTKYLEESNKWEKGAKLCYDANKLLDIIWKKDK